MKSNLATFGSLLEAKKLNFLFNQNIKSLAGKFCLNLF